MATQDNEQSPPRRYDTKGAAPRLSQLLGRDVSEKTMRNWRAQGRGPKCKYHGTTPIYDDPELVRYAATALTDESPLTRKRREAAPEQVAA